MDIKFDDKKLRKLANDPRKCKQEMGARRATLFLKRLTDLRDAETLEDVRHLPGRYHELKETRKGQWACDLDHPYRLIFIPQENPIPTNEDGQYIWFEIVGVEIIEIVDYH
nr:type II toxin-antitoxin system RelE/ParE family toxin [Sphingobacterium composti Ten et al. 2007 non Yoo et al. 2007]